MDLLSQKSTYCNWYYDLDVFSICRYHMVSEVQDTDEFTTAIIKIYLGIFGKEISI